MVYGTPGCMFDVSDVLAERRRLEQAYRLGYQNARTDARRAPPDPKPQ